MPPIIDTGARTAAAARASTVVVADLRTAEGGVQLSNGAGMDTEQSAALDFLADPATHRGAPVERIDTHISVVFLAGDRAYKLKRAVTFDYVDFSTLDRRRQCCQQELLLNQRTAPRLYQRVVAVTREKDGSLALDGAGPAVEWVVEPGRYELHVGRSSASSPA